MRANVAGEHHQVPHCAVMPHATARRADATGIEGGGDGPARRGTGRLDLTDDGQHAVVYQFENPKT